MSGPPQFGGQPVTNIRNVKSPHWRGWLGRAKSLHRAGDVVKLLGLSGRRSAFAGAGFNELAVQALRARADGRAAGLKATLNALKAEAITSANGIAGALNARGYATARGGKWTARSVLNVEARLR